MTDPEASASTAGVLRHVLIGAGGNVVKMHRAGLALDSVEVVAVADIDADAAARRAEELGCAAYTDHARMLAETPADVAVIMTPQFTHAALAVDCLGAGCHVLVEKPMALHVGEADAMIDAAAHADRLLAVNFQHRFRSEVRKARELLGAGALGAVQHADLTATWPRTAAYFRLGTWRATWAGEGGGVSMNQACHNLDVLCHLLGTPSRVAAWNRTQLHAIPTEDTVHAMLEWPGGALGSVHISTAEAGRRERLEITGSNGLMTLERGVLQVRQFDRDLRDFLREHHEPFVTPSHHDLEVDALEPEAGTHRAVYENLHGAILRGEPLLADGAEGRRSLELANAMIWSSSTGETVELPLDRDAYASLLEDLKADRVGVR